MTAPTTDASAASTGSAYERPEPTYRRELTEVGRGTPMGELLRRYWHPIGLVADAGATPRVVRVLGEDLILFRDGEGKPGLLYPRCAHRGTTLYYGKVEPHGIRCCYHGWLFGTDGVCLEQPCEPGGGRARAHARQPWYPLAEQYGLLWAYLGPPQRRPALPRYAALESLEPGEALEADDTSVGSGGGVIVPCNWLQHYENVVDPFHVPILHGAFSGPQFVEVMASMPQVAFETTARGVRATQVRMLDDGRRLRRVTEAVVPTLRVVPSPRLLRFGPVDQIGWVLPIDDTHFRIYVVGRVRTTGEIRASRSRQNGKLWEELTDAEHQRYPGDWEAQTGQGPITLHSEEHLASSDRGIALLRRFFRTQLDVVAAGGDPAGVSFGEPAPVELDAGNFIEA